MTAQITDTFIFKRKKYELIGIQGGGLFSPEAFDMEPEMIHTACYRGFYATYKLRKDALILTKLTIRDKNNCYPAIGGIEPNIEAGEGEAVYGNLNYKILFTGKLRLARDFIDELYIHMGFQKASAFKEVFDITINKGMIADIKDRSAEIEQKRGAFKKHYESGNIIERIDEAFKLDLDYE